MIYAEMKSVASYIPPRVLKNSDIETLMDTNNEWIIQRTGIEERHWADSNVSTSDLALHASLKAIENAGIKKEEIDMIIFATLSPDHDFPGSACFLQAKLGIPGIAALDIRQQCSGFIYGMSIADKFIRSGSHKTILLVGAEIHSKGLQKNPQGRDVGVLFGDGAGAAIITATNDKNHSIIDSLLHADGAYAKELWLPAAGSGFDSTERITVDMLNEGLHYPKMNGKMVFIHAIKKMSEVLLEILKKNNMALEDVDVFLFHQANLRINQKLAEDLKIPSEKVFNTIQKYGNTTAATIPIGMDEAIKAGVLKKGMTVATVAFGSGFTWGASIFKY